MKEQNSGRLICMRLQKIHFLKGNQVYSLSIGRVILYGYTEEPSEAKGQKIKCVVGLTQTEKMTKEEKKTAGIGKGCVAQRGRELKSAGSCAEHPRTKTDFAQPQNRPEEDEETKILSHDHPDHRCGAGKPPQSLHTTVPRGSGRASSAQAPVGHGLGAGSCWGTSLATKDYEREQAALLSFHFFKVFNKNYVCL